MKTLVILCLILADTGPINLPSITSAKPARVSKSAIKVEVRLDKDSKPVIQVEGKAVAMKDLKRTFKALVNKSREKELAVRAAGEVDYGTFMEIVNIAKAAGFKKFNLRLLPKKD